MPENTPKSSPSRLNRYSQSLIVLCAVIVFSTFVVKDNIEEEWRTTAQDVDAARNYFDLRDDLFRIELGVESEKYSHGRVLDQSRTDIDVHEQTIEKGITEIRQGNLYVMRDIQVLYPLIDRLPEHETYDKKLAVLNSHMDSVDHGVTRARGLTVTAADQYTKKS